MFFRNPQRLEAFSDGVFAIAITLLILEIKAPQVGEHASPAALWLGLGQLWPSYLAYVLAFSTILIAWIGHHMTIGQVKRMSHGLLYANGFFLLTISFLPFPTSVVAEHLRSASASAAVDFYAFANLLTSLAFYFLLRAVILEHPESRRLLLPSSIKSLVGVVWCVLCALLALLSPVLSLFLLALLWVWWTFPFFVGRVERMG